jgi:predicted metal-binding protein
MTNGNSDSAIGDDIDSTLGDDRGSARRDGIADANRDDIASWRERAIELGVSDAVVLTPDQVVTAEWVRLKCLFGCDPGRCRTCPPFSPEPAQTRRILDEYSAVLLLRLDVPAAEAIADDWLRHSRRMSSMALALERELFLAGLHKTFAIAGGRPCSLNEACGRPDDCDCCETVRPGPAGCGIDVFATSRNAGWELSVVPRAGEPYHVFALLLLE